LRINLRRKQNMNLKPTEIPVEFLQAIPAGIKLVSRGGNPYLVMERLEDAAGNSLMDESVQIHGEPSIRVKAKVGKTEGFLFIDAYWGSHAKLYDFIPDFSGGNTVEAFSPTDGASLMVPWSCPIDGCDETHGIRFNLPGGKNTILVCGKLGCPGHKINISLVDEGISDTLNSINFFGVGDNDWFSDL
jgi:hypothetical protein